ERLVLDDRSLHADRRQARRGGCGGGQVAHGPADADDRPAQPLAPWDGGELLEDVGPQGVALLRTGRLAFEEALGHADGAEPPGGGLDGSASTHADELKAAAAQIEHGSVAQRRRVDGGEIAEIRLLLRAGAAGAPPRRRPRASRPARARTVS